MRAGAIVTREGAQIGEHGGQHRFTIGQRRGLDVALGRRVYVVGKDAATNTVTVGEKEDLLCGSCTVGEANWLVEVPSEELHCWAKYRYNTPACRAVVRTLEDGVAPTPSGRVGRFAVEFAERQEAVAAGQALVLYADSDPDQVLGGGWILDTRGRASTRAP